MVIKPQSLNIDELLGTSPKLLSTDFPDHLFDGIQGYNELMLTDEFYARFAAYEFILIYQLDAFVFSDQLLHWCSRSYDYIGAPWFPPGEPSTTTNRALIALRRKWYRVFDIPSPHSGRTHEAQLNYSVGNGGLSLRRVTAMRRVLKDLSARVEPYRKATRNTWSEDIFFSIEANRYRRHLRTPTVCEAARFSWETNPLVAARLGHIELPFGCHAWNKLHRDVWHPIFANLGYSIDALAHATPSST